jgi:large subunit ribosomal protein L13
MIINAENLIVGRVAAYAAKQSLLGETVDIVNCEKAVITGSKANVLEDWSHKRLRGGPTKGPFIPRLCDRFVRRIVRGMLSHKEPRGRAAFARIMCYTGIPDQFAGKEMITIEKASIDKLPNYKYMTIKEICKLLGGKE